MPKNVVCKKCNNLKNAWCEKVIDSPDPDMVRDCRHFWERTNADRIRAMSDEELADVIMCPMEISCISDLCEKNLSYTCVECSLQWLREPAEEGQ